jgi:hypothetical protein
MAINVYHAYGRPVVPCSNCIDGNCPMNCSRLYSEGQECPSCKLPYKDGDTCPAIRGGCPLGGDF